MALTKVRIDLQLGNQNTGESRWTAGGWSDQPLPR